MPRARTEYLRANSDFEIFFLLNFLLIAPKNLIVRSAYVILKIKVIRTSFLNSSWIPYTAKTAHYCMRYFFTIIVILLQRGWPLDSKTKRSTRGLSVRCPFVYFIVLPIALVINRHSKHSTGIDSSAMAC